MTTPPRPAPLPAITVRDVAADELAAFLRPALTALGVPPVPERIEQTKALPELAHRLSAFDGASAVGAAGSYHFELSVPAAGPGRCAQLAIAGLTMVGVLPTHRRRGVLTALMRRHLDEARRSGRPLSALFASEGGIYRRFGYGMASLCAEAELDPARAAFAPSAPLPSRERVRLVLLEEDEAAAVFPPIWDRVRAGRPGLLSRSEAWWRLRRIGDPPWTRAGRMPLQRVLLELDGRPAAYAIYRLSDSGWDSANLSTLSADVLEALGDGPEATAALWRYLVELDLLRTLRAHLLPLDHPLLFLLSEGRRLRLRTFDGLWLRLVDVEAALRARGYPPGPPLVLEVEDPFCPWNQGRYRVAAQGSRVDVARTDAEPALRLPVEALGSVYLGGFRFTQLAAAGCATELVPGALHHADRLFATTQAPWAPEIF
ncbi:MAG: GNAT family N-acetyltransferase [Polyangia bacterium]